MSTIGGVANATATCRSREKLITVSCNAPRCTLACYPDEKCWDSADCAHDSKYYTDKYLCIEKDM